MNLNILFFAVVALDSGRAASASSADFTMQNRSAVSDSSAPENHECLLDDFQRASCLTSFHPTQLFSLHRPSS